MNETPIYKKIVFVWYLRHSNLRHFITCLYTRLKLTKLLMNMQFFK